MEQFLILLDARTKCGSLVFPERKLTNLKPDYFPDRICAHHHQGIPDRVCRLRDEMEYAKEARRTLHFYGLITFESTPGFAFFMLLVVNIKKVSKVFFSAFTIIATQKDAVTHYSQHNSSVKCGIKMCIFSSVYVARTDKVSFY